MVHGGVRHSPREIYITGWEALCFPSHRGREQRAEKRNIDEEGQGGEEQGWTLRDGVGVCPFTNVLIFTEI